MGILRAFVTVTEQGGEADADGIQLTVVAEPGQYIDQTSQVEIQVFTNPDSWVDDVVISSSNGTIVGGGSIFYKEVEDENVQLTAQEEDQPATGNAQLPIAQGFDVVQYGGVGGAGNATDITYVELGRNGLKTLGNCTASVGKIKYRSKGKKWILQGMTQPEVVVEAMLDTGEE